MTEIEFTNWLKTSTENLTKIQQFILVSRVILSISFLLFLVSILPGLIIMFILVFAIGSYKRAFEELAIIHIELSQIEQQLQTSGVSWFHSKSPVYQNYLLLMSHFELVKKADKDFAYLILVFMFFTIISFI